MKINIDVDNSLQEDAVTIHCREITDEIIELQRLLSERHTKGQTISAYIDDTEYYVEVRSVIFLEADGNYISLHTAREIYRIRQRLYELEEILPRGFFRVSKSTIVNTDAISSIRKNIMGASEISFRNCQKKAYASRNYIKSLLQIMDEKRLKK
ncbi:transcriptional regulator, LytTR family [Lachnospiraceae bacterium]|nr:transcriptional regulator, LytTR family [Lachnospiraceae bacterium]